MSKKPLIPIECPECYSVRYGEKAMIEHLIHGELWREKSAKEFVKAEVASYEEGVDDDKQSR